MGELAMETFPKKYTNKILVYDKARIEDLGPPYDAFVRYAKQMSPGEITDPIKSRDHVLVMKLLEYTEEGDWTFEEVRDDIESGLEEMRFRKQRQEVYFEALQEINPEDLDKFIKLCVMEAYNRWNGKAQ